MAETQKLTAQQRAQLFAASTRQHYQMLGQQEVSGGAQTISFRIPKARILQGIRLYVEAKVNVKHASGTAKALGPLDAYKIFRRISLDLNNGFMPIVVSGYQAALLNMLSPLPEMVKASADGTTLCKCPASLTASSSGTDNTIEFMLDLPITLNYRDTTGLILAQNTETNIDLTCDIANAGDIIDNASGYTCEFTSLKIKPQVTSFSIPAKSEWFPDMSILKIWSARSETFTAGQNYIKMQTGMIYRKLIFMFETSDGAAMTPEELTSNLELVLNTADIPYSIDPKMLKAVNKMQIGTDVPEGVYFFAFDWQGFAPGYSGSRDYIDAERVTEFAVRFNAANPGKLTIISEQLSRLIAG